MKDIRIADTNGSYLCSNADISKLSDIPPAFKKFLKVK